MQLINTHCVPEQENAIRLQEYAVGIFITISTKSGIKKAIKKKLIFVNGNLASTALYINGGEIIELYQPDDTKTSKTFIFPLDVLFEDDFLAVIYKPSGILVSGNKFATIKNALTQNLQKSNQIDAVKPQPIHRLDYATSGVLLIGKTSKSIIALNKLFENTKISKTYHAITIGKMKQAGSINFSVDKKAAQSDFTVLQSVNSERFIFLNLVKLSPKTGRKHQLRKHLSAIRNPILGDATYGKEKLILKGKGLYLHASGLEFTHPITKESIMVAQELPKKFKSIFHL